MFFSIKSFPIPWFCPHYIPIFPMFWWNKQRTSQRLGMSWAPTGFAPPAPSAACHGAWDVHVATTKIQVKNAPVFKQMCCFSFIFRFPILWKTMKNLMLLHTLTMCKGKVEDEPTSPCFTKFLDQSGSNLIHPYMREACHLFPFLISKKFRVMESISPRQQKITYYKGAGIAILTTIEITVLLVNIQIYPMQFSKMWLPKNHLKLDRTKNTGFSILFHPRF